MHIAARSLTYILFSSLYFLTLPSLFAQKLEVQEYYVKGFPSTQKGIRNIEICRQELENNKIHKISELKEKCNFLKNEDGIIYYKYGDYNIFFIYGDIVDDELKDVYNIILDNKNNYFFRKFTPQYVEGYNYDFYQKTETKNLMESAYRLKLKGPRGWADGFPQTFQIWKEN